MASEISNTDIDNLLTYNALNKTKDQIESEVVGKSSLKHNAAMQRALRSFLRTLQQVDKGKKWDKWISLTFEAKFAPNLSCKISSKTHKNPNDRSNKN